MKCWVTHPVLVNEDVSGDVEYECVKVMGVKRQCVIIVKAIDLNVLQTHLIISKDGVWVHKVVWYHRN